MSRLQENAQALRLITRGNLNGTEETDVEFFAVLPNKKAAQSIMRQYFNDQMAGGPEVKTDLDDAIFDEVEVCFTSHLPLNHKAITQFESKLDRRVSAAGGYLDGWGILQH